MSYLIDTDLLSLLERKKPPIKLLQWVRQNEGEIFVSVVTIAELQHGIDLAPATHQPSLNAWLAETKQLLAPATEELSEPVLVRWKQLLSALKRKNRTMSCEDSLIAATALYHGHSIATRNTRHFEPAEVTLINPLE